MKVRLKDLSKIRELGFIVNVQPKDVMITRPGGATLILNLGIEIFEVVNNNTIKLCSFDKFPELFESANDE